MTAAEKAFLRRYGPFEVLACADGSLIVQPGRLRDDDGEGGPGLPERARAERLIQELIDEATRQ